MMAEEQPRLTGRHVLVWILSFFGVITLVNMVMIWFALTTNEAVLKRTTMNPSTSGLAVVQVLETRRARWQT